MIGCAVFRAKGYTDANIAKATVYSAREHSSTTIRTSIYLLILLLYYAEFDEKPRYFKSVGWLVVELRPTVC